MKIMQARKKFLNATTSISIAATLASFAIFLFEFKSVEYFAISIGIIGAMTGGIFAYSIARLRTAVNAPKIFISYSNKDLDFVLKLHHEIEKFPVNVLFDKHELNVGDIISQKISELIDTSDYFLLVVSKNNLKSRWFNRELENAINKNKKILPVVIDKVPVPKIISDLVYADFQESFDSGISQITKALGISPHPLKNTP